MKSHLLRLTLGLTLLVAPALAQQSLQDAAAEPLRTLSPDQAQTEALMQLLIGELPRLMDESADPAELSRELQRLLKPEQVRMLRQVEAEMGPSTGFGTMGREERRRLILGGVERLSHPSQSQWLERIDSFDL